MKFKATLSDRGLRVLERAFLPTLEKLGKRCQVGAAPFGLEGAGAKQAPQCSSLPHCCHSCAVKLSSCQGELSCHPPAPPVLQLLLSPEDVHLIQGVTDTDGLQDTARLANVRGAGTTGLE